MPPPPAIPQLAIKVDGQRIPDQALQDVLECTVENSLHLPDACTIRVHDAEFHWIDQDLFHEGKQVEVLFGQEREPLVTVFEGEITTLDFDLAGQGVPTITVRCLDQAHRLHRGRERRTFENQTDTDVVRGIAREMGFQVQAEDTREVHPWTIQNNQTNWEFLQMLAARDGYRLFMADRDTLHFEPVRDETAKKTALDWGGDLRSFRIRASAGPQVDEVVVRGWDPQTKQPIVGTARRPEGAAQTGERSVGGAVARQAFGAARETVVDQTVTSQEAAQRVAQSRMDAIGGGFVEADGLCFGHPEIKAGEAVEIGNIGRRFSGRYIVTAVTHTYSLAEGLTTQFVISGKRASNLMETLGGGAGGAAGDNAVASKTDYIVVGIVTDNDDPSELGRVKVKYPQLTEDHQSDWARIASPMAGAGRGFMFLPEIDDEVLVAFEHGDIHRPYILGGLWNGADKPPLKTSDAVVGGKVRRRRIRTRYGHVLDFDDNGTIHLRTAGGEHLMLADGSGVGFITPTEHQVYATNDGQIAMATKDGSSVSITQEAKTIDMSDEDGSNTVSIDYGTGAVTITGATSVSISGGASVSIDAANVSINSGAPAVPPAPGGGSGSPDFDLPPGVAPPGPSPLPPPPPPPLE